MELFDILTYEYTKVSNILNIPADPVWTPIASVTALGAVAGTYELKLSIQGLIADINDSVSVRYRVNGGTWYVYRKEASDPSDTFGFSYGFPWVHAATGDITLDVEAQKDVGAAQFDINFADVIIQRVQ